MKVKVKLEVEVTVTVTVKVRVRVRVKATRMIIHTLLKILQVLALNILQVDVNMFRHIFVIKRGTPPSVEREQ